MVLCRKCAHTVRPGMLHCPRCGLSWPYVRSARFRLETPSTPGVMLGRRCRRCGSATQRDATPFWLKPVRTLSGERVSVRRCVACRWRGVAFHAPRRSRARS